MSEQSPQSTTDTSPNAQAPVISEEASAAEPSNGNTDSNELTWRDGPEGSYVAVNKNGEVEDIRFPDEHEN